MLRSPHLKALSLALFLLVGLTACASDGEKPPKAEESWRTASQRVPEKNRRPSPSELAKQAKARDLAAAAVESAAESDDESEGEQSKGEGAEADEISADGLEPPVRLDPDGPSDRDTYLRLRDDWPRPVEVHAPPPEYNPDARQARIQGVTIFDVLIDETGEVQGADLVKGLPMGLTLEAYKAVKTWRFEPVVVDGEPRRVIYRLKVSFFLQ